MQVINSFDLRNPALFLMALDQYAMECPPAQRKKLLKVATDGTRALGKTSKWTKTAFALGTLNFHRGAYKAASRWFLLAETEAYGDLAAAYTSLGNVHLKLRQWTKASYYYKLSVAHLPRDQRAAAIAYLMFLLYSEKCDAAKARYFRERFLKLYPKHNLNSAQAKMRRSAATNIQAD